MKTRTSFYHRTFVFAYVLLIAVIFCGCNYSIVDINKTITALEQAYFEGQKDALEGDIRIKKSSDNCWIWTKSCWNSGEQPIFNPGIVCGDDNKK